MTQRKTEKQIIEEYFQSFALEECLDEVNDNVILYYTTVNNDNYK